MIHVTEIMNGSHIDILCVTESWLVDSDISIIQAALPKTHAIIHVPRSTVGARGGGIAMIYPLSISNIRMIHSDLVVSSFEFMEVAINVNHQVARLAVVYRPGHPATDRNFIEEFGMFLENFTAKTGKLMICGDFNYWVDSPVLKPYSREFLELIAQNNFANHVSGSTHISGHTLDLVVSPVDSNYISEVYIAPIDSVVSDHALVTFNLDFPRPASYRKSITFRNYHNIDETMIVREVEHYLGSIDTSALSAGELVEIHNNFFRSLSDHYCPEITKKILVRDNSPWYDSSVASLRRDRRRSERKWRRLRTDLSKLEYVAARRAVVSAVHTRKVEYYRGYVASCGGDQKLLFNVVNSFLGSKSVRTLPFSTSDTQLANDFASFFESKILRIRNELDNDLSDTEFSVRFGKHFTVARTLTHFQPVGMEDVRQYIRELNKTFCQLDPINVSKILLSYESAAFFVGDIINHAFEEKIFVSSEKQALLRPLLKKVGLDTEIMSNYRPVSNLSFLSKIMERAMLDQLLSLFNENRVIPLVQSAYRKCHSTETALCRIYNDLVATTCTGNSSLLILLDLSAAFDTVDHRILLQDFWDYGVQDSALSLVKSYLSDRFQRVVVGTAISEPTWLQFGVPQGSVLGPVLFAAYSSSLVSLLRAHSVDHHFYADDTQIYVCIENIEDIKNKVKSLLSDIKIWMKRRKLRLNEGKTEIMVIHGNTRSIRSDDFGSLNLGEAQLSPAETVRNLGVIFDSSLSFKNHIDLVIRNCNFCIRNLYAVRRYLDRQCLLTLIHSLVLSRVDYCNCLWVGLPKYSLRRLQSVLNRAARLVFLAPPRTPTTSFLIELHWLPIKARIEYKICLMTYKVIKFGEPEYLSELLLPATGGSAMELRSSDDDYNLNEPRAVQERSFADRSFSYVAPRLYNRLPASMKQLASVDVFKKQLKTFLFLRAYDTVNGIVTDDYRV